MRPRCHTLKMERIESLLAANEEELSLPELEKVVLLLSETVQPFRSELQKAQTDLQNLQTETSERSKKRQWHVSVQAQIQDMQEALEEEEKTQQELREAKEEMEKLSGPPLMDSSESLESRLRQMEDELKAYQEEERELQEGTESLKKSLKVSQERLTETSSEHQRVSEELHTLLNSPPDQPGPGPNTAEHLLDSCIREMGLLNVLPDKKRHK